MHALRPGRDLFYTYYRDLAVLLALGMTPAEVMLGFLAKDGERMSGARQFPLHGAYPDLGAVNLSNVVGTQVPQAVGAALAARMRGEDTVVIVYFGDGASSVGDCHEAMNFAGVHRLPVIFFCENNGYAISVPRSRQMAVENVAGRAEGYGMPGVIVDGCDVVAIYEATTEAAARARSGRGPTLIEAMVERYLPHTSDDDDRRVPGGARDRGGEGARPAQNPWRQAPGNGGALGGGGRETARRGQARGQRGHGLRRVRRLSRRPVLLRPRLRRYRRAIIAVKTVIEAVRDGMREELARDERVFVLGEDVGRRGGVFLATDGFVDEFGEDRIIDTPLAESSIAGIALGAAMNGMRPIAEIQFADFIWPTFNQLLGEAAKARYGSEGRVGAPLVARTPYGGGVRGGLYHSQSVEAFFTHSPGIKVVAPATPYDAKGLLKSAVRDDDPVVFLEHKRTYRLVRGEVPDEEYTVPIGEADVKIEGEHLSVITYGLMLHHCAEAARSLAAEGISVEVVDLRTLFPMDTATVLDSVRKTGKALVVHEDSKTGGVGGEVAAVIAEEAFDYLDGPIVRLAGPDVPAMPFSPPLEAEFMLNTEKISAAIRQLASY